MEARVPISHKQKLYAINKKVNFCDSSSVKAFDIFICQQKHPHMISYAINQNINMLIYHKQNNKRAYSP